MSMITLSFPKIVSIYRKSIAARSSRPRSRTLRTFLYRSCIILHAQSTEIMQNGRHHFISPSVIQTSSLAYLHNLHTPTLKPLITLIPPTRITKPPRSIILTYIARLSPTAMTAYAAPRHVVERSAEPAWLGAPGEVGVGRHCRWLLG